MTLIMLSWTQVPGIRYWSINSLAVADVLFLTLKYGDLDIEGTIKMAKDIYGSFTKFGSKSFLLLNKVAGYCIPRDNALNSPPAKYNKNKNENNSGFSHSLEETPIELKVISDDLNSDAYLSDQTRMEMISCNTMLLRYPIQEERISNSVAIS